MAAGSRYGVYWSILYGWVISSMLMGVRCKSGISSSSVKGLLK